jgi:hypothetical protein
MPRSEEVVQRAGSLRAMTGLPQQEFTTLLPHVAHAVLASRADRTMAGQPRTSRRYSTDETAPVPTMADKWRFMLTSVQQHPIQAGQGHLVGMSPAKANTWIHRLHPVGNQALAHQEWLPARTADAFATRLAATRMEAGPTRALCVMMVPNAPATARKIQRTRKRITVASSNATRSNTSLCALRPVASAS